MNIFIDTSVIYTDPFWKRNFAKEILYAAKEKRINIYISDVVVRELRINFKEQLEREIGKIRNSNNAIRKLVQMHKKIELPVVDKYLKDFDEFYQYNFQNENMIKLNHSKEFFAEILDRAITKKRPFFGNKSEFKDAVIWVTYYKYALKNKLKKCFLLTNNISDFAVSKKNFELHPDLKSDYDLFKLNITLEEFYKANKTYIDKPVLEFNNWISRINIDEEFVFNLIFKSQSQTVFDEIQRKYENIKPDFFYPDEKFNLKNGYVEVNELEYYNCTDIEVVIMRNFANISGVLNVNVDMELFSNNSTEIINIDGYNYFDNIKQEVQVLFNFVFDKGKKIKDFEITFVN